MNIPMNRKEMMRRGWDGLDIILVTGDAFIDHPSFGTALIARVLEAAGWRVGVISQPDWKNTEDISALGRPRLFFGVTSGNVDSMVANYTSSGKKRKSDDYTPGGVGGARPDRAVIVYSNLIRRAFKDVRIVLGGVEASLRRFSHYDWWSNKVRKSVLLDSKADLLVYGMGEKPILEVSRRLASGELPADVPGTVVWSSARPQGVELPSHEEVSADHRRYFKSVRLLYDETDPVRGQLLYQLQDSRFVIQNPPPRIDSNDLDSFYRLPYTRQVHPACLEKGPVKALETVRYSITTHRGCYGQCNFCAITLHQGRIVVSRSEESIIEEVSLLSRSPDFRGTITDLGGPTANMYGYECPVKLKKGACKDKRCLFPEVCVSLRPDHSRYIGLLERVASVPGVKHVFVSSGIRYDLILADKVYGREFLRRLIEKHISGQLKIAPEHSSDRVLELMGKPSRETLEKFLKEFYELSKGKKRYVIGYFIAAHPGCRLEDMVRLRRFVAGEMNYRPEQVQIFTPTPSTISTAMYFTELDGPEGRQIFVETSFTGRMKQKDALSGKESPK
ncbi:MAG: YgiQ family radical SAM protein [Thermotogota bacterium]|nr:YgiQ family radical SAM protein [Thermotogota bacterium]